MSQHKVKLKRRERVDRPSETPSVFSLALLCAITCLSSLLSHDLVQSYYDDMLWFLGFGQ
jgi:hypothetical protein